MAKKSLLSYIENRKCKDARALIYNYKGLQLVLNNIESVIENHKKKNLYIFTPGKTKPYVIPLAEKKKFFEKLDNSLDIRKALRYNYERLHIILDNIEAFSEISEESKLRLYMQGSKKNYFIPLAEKKKFVSYLIICLSTKRDFFYHT